MAMQIKYYVGETQEKRRGSILVLSPTELSGLKLSGLSSVCNPKMKQFLGFKFQKFISQF
jgi:hypothetical protein